MQSAVCLLLFGLLLHTACSKQVQLPIFMANAPVAAKAEFTNIVSRPDLQPAQRRQAIEQLVARQSADVQQAYQQYKNLVQEHKNKFGISLEDELEKARQQYQQRG
ncbi:hypothetical protein M3Y99_00168100 [Aphelenchoides fujianensis]|nr:hypothetical protein M3Y99_00168100 [Aphelenchoides fujianensis]